LKENCYSRDEIKKFNGDIFFNEVIQTLSGLKLTKNFHRFNGWNTFLERDRIEVCSNNQPAAVKVLALLKWAPVFCPDVPGFISARVVAMIINEAYFALGENISSTTDIDLALKLGTNYPYGPFEWAEKIGLLKIHKLLTALSDSSERYLIAPALNKALAKPTLN
jgi:3-hydroxybutyryl-CoA dehydrogenase